PYVYARGIYLGDELPVRYLDPGSGPSLALPAVRPSARHLRARPRTVNFCGRPALIFRFSGHRPTKVAGAGGRWPVAGGRLRNGTGTARHILNRTPAAFSLTCHNSAPAWASRAALLMPTRRGLPRSWPTPAGPKYAPPVTSGSVAAIRIGRAPVLAVWPIRRAPQSTTFHGNWIPPSAGPVDVRLVTA